MKIAYLASATTLPGSPQRRDDAFEHDLMMEALTGPFSECEMDLRAVDWRDETLLSSGFDAALIGTAWDYWEHHDRFMSKLEALSTRIPLFNTAKMVRWNSQKTYLRDLEQKGARLIPTLWVEHMSPAKAADALALFVRA